MTYCILVMCRGEVSSRKLIDVNGFSDNFLAESSKQARAINTENE
jgi:hypothetical protein